MATITYTDHHGGAPTINWLGREFTSTVPVEVDPEKDAGLIETAKQNQFFTVDENGKAPKSDDTIVAKGQAAARDGKRRLVPVAYRGEDKKPQANAWLFGYDQIPQSDDPFADPKEQSQAQPASDPKPDDKKVQSPLAVATANTGGGPVSPTATLQAGKDAGSGTAADKK